MRFLANENIPLLVVNALRTQGHDIVSATVLCRGATDRQVLDLATQEGRIVVTFDKDYGELIFRRREPAPAGVILLRFPPRSAEYIQDRLTRIITSDLPLAGRFTIVSEGRARSIPVNRR